MVHINQLVRLMAIVNRYVEWKLVIFLVKLIWGNPEHTECYSQNSVEIFSDNHYITGSLRGWDLIQISFISK